MERHRIDQRGMDPFGLRERSHESAGTQVGGSTASTPKYVIGVTLQAAVCDATHAHYSYCQLLLQSRKLPGHAHGGAYRVDCGTGKNDGQTQSSVENDLLNREARATAALVVVPRTSCPPHCERSDRSSPKLSSHSTACKMMRARGRWSMMFTRGPPTTRETHSETTKQHRPHDDYCCDKAVVLMVPES